MEYSSRDGRYRLRLTSDAIKKHEDFLRQFLKTAYDKNHESA